jgi:hypothetical protein
MIAMSEMIDVDLKLVYSFPTVWSSKCKLIIKGITESFFLSWVDKKRMEMKKKMKDNIRVTKKRLSKFGTQQIRIIIF